MSEQRPVDISEEGLPLDGIGSVVDEMVELYGGEVTASRETEREFTLPLRRGVATGGALECTISWAPKGDSGEVRLRCDRGADAPKSQRILLLVAGVVGAVLFMLWPFYPGEKAFGTLAWLGGAVAIAVYIMTLRRSSGGIASDFLQRVVARQRDDTTNVAPGAE